MFTVQLCTALATVLAVQSVLAQNSCQGHAKLPTWSYKNQEAWPAQSCRKGRYQSPINVGFDDAIYLNRSIVVKSPIKFKEYEPFFNALVENNGRTVRMSPVNNKTTVGLLTGGPLGSREYKFSHLDFHWPSEHTIHGHSYPLEMQLVHHRADLTPEAAVNEPDGYAVISIFFSNTPYLYKLENRRFHDSLEFVQAVRKPLASVCQRFSLLFLIRRQLGSVYTYKGSLTTPNCNESVIWILRTRVLKITTKELEIFSKVDVGSQSNNRQQQPVNGRTVYYRNIFTGWHK